MVVDELGSRPTHPGVAGSDRSLAGRSREPALLVAGLVVAAFLASFGALHYGFFKHGLLMDTPLYERYGDAMVHGRQLPYRDFSVEYPPGALPVFAAPSLLAGAGDFSRYARWFEVEMLLCGAAAAALCGAVLARRGVRLAPLAAGTLLVGLAPLALGPVVLSRYDLWPAALTIAALAALALDRRRLAFAVLGLSIAAKVYPVVLLPLFVIDTARRRGRREAGLCASIAAAVVGVALAPFLVLAPHGVVASLTGQASRPLQIESLGASALLAAHQAWGLPLTEVSSHGSDNLVGRLPDALARAQSLAALAGLALVWLAFGRGSLDRDRLLRYSSAAVCTFVALDKVLSPQYLIWLMALVPLVRGRRGIVASVLFLAAMVLTQLWFPQHYIQLVYGLDGRASWLVVARDLVLVALLVVLVWPSRRARRTGVVTAAALLAGAAAAAGMAAASPGIAGGPTHSGLLTETGTPTGCRAGRIAPATTPGSVHYGTESFTNPGAASCVTVTLSAKPHQQLFSVAYRNAFDAADPRAGYLGDAGTCTNIAGATGGAVAYSFRVPARTRFVVEVEECSPGGSVVPYTLDVAAGSGRRIRFASASARRTGADVVASWQAVGAGSFALYRVRDGRAALVGNGRSPLRDPGEASSLDVRYWIRATTRDGGWHWRGPLTARR